jgi:hypothetical protein
LIEGDAGGHHGADRSDGWNCSSLHPTPVSVTRPARNLSG